MELKINNQFTYFLQSYIIETGKLTKYILKLLNDKRFELKIFEKNKDLETYTNFLPKIREFLFATFDLDDIAKKEELKKLPLETQAALLAKYPSISFEYNLEQEIQGKTIDENSIFFKIQKIGIVIFNTGVCFLYIKTNLENNCGFEEILDFNYKFRDIKQEDNTLENIKIQTDSFENIEELQDFIKSIIGPNIDTLKLNIETERFYTFSYTCIDKENWNDENQFEAIKESFAKYVNIMPNNSNSNTLINQNSKIISNSKYAKIGISKLGISILGSDYDLENKTTLPKKCETEYLYIYILSLYLKIYLKKLNYEFKEGRELEKVRKNFVDFTKNIFIQEITSNDIESLYYTYLKDVLEIEQLYDTVKNKYNILYNELKIEKNEKMSWLIILVVAITLILNIINFIVIKGK